MQLTQVKFRNINSYGNRWQTINFDPNDPGLYQICGENGTGKSTISQVLKLGLYGKVQGGKTKAKCVNRVNKSGEIVISFETRLGKVDIHRCFLPDSFSLKVAGIEYKQAGVKNVQEYLEENLIGIPPKIFNNSVSLSINDFKSFLKMTPEDKREIVDKIFGLESLNKMRKLLNEETKEIKNFLSKCEDKISLIEDSINSAKEELLVVEEKLKDDNSEKIQNLNKKHEEISVLKDPIEEKKTKASEAKEKLEKLERKLSSERQTIKTNLDNLSRQKKLYESDKCPTCGSSLDSEEHKHKYQEMLDEETEYRNRLQEIVQKSEEVNLRMGKAKNVITEF